MRTGLTGMALVVLFAAGCPGDVHYLGIRDVEDDPKKGDPADDLKAACKKWAAAAQDKCLDLCLAETEQEICANKCKQAAVKDYELCLEKNKTEDSSTSGKDAPLTGGGGETSG